MTNNDNLNNKSTDNYKICKRSDIYDITQKSTYNNNKITENKDITNTGKYKSKYKKCVRGDMIDLTENIKLYYLDNI